MLNVFLFFVKFSSGRSISASELFGTAFGGPGAPLVALGGSSGGPGGAPVSAIKHGQIRGLGALGPLMEALFVACGSPRTV